ncbi:hypothetical protein [Pseudomonas syringae group genomosp. 3]|uniref:hypothetical protein n=1 Tax=Pseudomonas syringae group genomosp. 3 TaxID=251701 RepID=UPI00070D9A61|nr:hypothetical protein [Pseudomonas syringae group genomosp. 3]
MEIDAIELFSSSTTDSLAMPVNTGLGIIGICGSGGFSVAATAIDHSIKALIPVSVYDMGRVRVRDFWTSKVI